MSHQKYWNNLYRYATFSAILLALIGVAFAFFPKVSQFRNYQETKSNLEAEIRTEEEHIKELRLKQERFGTDKYFVQQIAHEIGFAHKDEVIFQFNDPQVTNSETSKK